MPHAAPARAEVAFPDPPPPKRAYTGPASENLPHIVTARNVIAGDLSTGPATTGKGVVARRASRTWRDLA